MVLITWKEAARLAGVHFGAQGGRKAAENMTPEQRKARATKAILTRWAKHRAAKEAATTTQQPIGSEIAE